MPAPPPGGWPVLTDEDKSLIRELHRDYPWDNFQAVGLRFEQVTGKRVHHLKVARLLKPWGGGPRRFRAAHEAEAAALAAPDPAPGTVLPPDRPAVTPGDVAPPPGPAPDGADAELRAIRMLVEALTPLRDPRTVARVLWWANERFGQARPLPA